MSQILCHFMNLSKFEQIDQLMVSASLDQLMVSARVSIVPGLFQFSSPGTFGLVKSRDHGTTGPSRSLGPVLSGPGTFPGRPGKSRDKITLYIYALKSFQCRSSPLRFTTKVHH